MVILIGSELILPFIALWASNKHVHTLMKYLQKS